MILTCPKCEARLQVDDAKAPQRPFSVRCPKCQTSVNVQGPPVTASELVGSEGAKRAENPAVIERPSFEPPLPTTPFKSTSEVSAPTDTTPQNPSVALNDLAKLLADALRHGDVRSSSRKRPAWDLRKALVCASPAYRETIARLLADGEYEVFVAANTAQALSNLREEHMDVIVLDANFDPVEQGVAFVTREVRLLRPAERRRLFFVYLAAGVRTMDLHAAFLHNVNVVVNPSDVDQLPEVLAVSIRHYNELYRDFNRALDVAPI